MGMMNNIWSNLREKFSNLSPSNIQTIDDAQKRLDEGKSITFNNPKSERYTYYPNLAGKHNEKFRPETKEEKKTLSPTGFFRIGEINEERKRNVEDHLETARQQLGKKKLTKSQAALVTKQAESTPMYSQDVPSTALKSFKYNPVTESLYVQFQNEKGSSKVYWYPRVPKKKIEELASAPSKGEYFMENIHDQYTLNPGHKHSANVDKVKRVASGYYKKMMKAYNKGRKKGTMKGVLNK